MQLQVTDHRRIEQRDRIARRRIAKARVELLGDGGATHDGAALDDAHRLPRSSEVGRAHEPVMAATDDDGIEPLAVAAHAGVARARYSSMPAATVEKPQSTYVTSPVIALASSDR